MVAYHISVQVGVCPVESELSAGEVDRLGLVEPLHS